jgi:hypothetical protein
LSGAHPRNRCCHGDEPGADPAPAARPSVFGGLDLARCYTSGVGALLGESFIRPLAPTGFENAAVNPAGVLIFFGEVIRARADSDGLIPEANGDDNSARKNPCFPPTARPFRPGIEWTTRGSAIPPPCNQVMMTPFVINLTEDNGNGRVDQADIPDVVFSTFHETGNWADGVLSAVNGLGGSELSTVGNPSCRAEGTGSIAVRDIDRDRAPEIIAGNTALNADGSVHGSEAGRTGIHKQGPPAFAADLDLEGDFDVPAGGTAYRPDGSIDWSPAEDGLPAAGNFGDDPYPAAVPVSGRSVSLREHAGDRKLGPLQHPGIDPGAIEKYGGARTVDDFDVTAADACENESTD